MTGDIILESLVEDFLVKEEHILRMRLAESHFCQYDIVEESRLGERLRENRVVRVIRDWISRFIDYIKKLWVKIINRTKNIYYTNQEWFDANNHRFDNLSDRFFLNLKFKCKPYWKTEDELVSDSIPVTKLEKAKDIIKRNPDLTTEDELFVKLVPEIARYHKSISKATKLYYTDGVDIDEEVSGAANVKKHIELMRKYCSNYYNHMVKSKKLINDIEVQLRELDNEMKDLDIDDRDEFRVISKTRLYIGIQLKVATAKFNVMETCFHRYIGILKSIIGPLERNAREDTKKHLGKKSWEKAKVLARK